MTIEREEAREMARAEREQGRPCPFCCNPEPTVDEIEARIRALKEKK
jgi:hypothetical protein